jgi:hypothetical protein
MAALAHLDPMRKPKPKSVPVSIPLVVLDVHEDGTVTVTVDGEPLDPEPFAPPWRRSSFGQIIDRDTEFVEFVTADVAARREAEEAFYRNLDPDTGEVS